MIKTLFTHILLFLLTCLVACSSSERTNVLSTDTPAATDSTTISDAVVKHHPDENKVIDDIQFGIDRKEFDKLSALFLSKSNRDALLRYSLGDYKFIGLEGDFDDDRLYSARMTGNYISYEDYKSRLLDQVESLRLILFNKYGNHSTGDGPPEWHRTEENYSYLTYGWIVGTKTVEIRVANHGTHLSADLHIFQPEVVANLEKNEADQSQATAKKAKDVL